MSKIGSQFIINLVKLPNGYLFDSYQEAGNLQSKKKSAPKDKNKNPLNRTHRIFRQLALDPPEPQELLNPIQEESEPVLKLVQPEPEEQFSVEIKRENGLPDSPAKWYDQSSIHDIEKESLPEFFNGKSYKTPGLYLKFRNFIVTLYRKNPAQYLTKIACRRILRGDVNTVMKIHSFLQKQGVINFCVSKQGNYNFTPSIFTKVLNQQAKNGLPLDISSDKDEEVATQPIDTTNITVTTVNKCFSKSNRVFCHKCNSICGILWYRKKQQADKNINLCLTCFDKLSKGEAEEYTKTDIVKKIQSGVQDNKSVWSIDDNLKLLHYVSKPTENWEDLQNSFEKKKSFDDIMLQFMQFPIGNFDPFKDKISESLIKDSQDYHLNKLIERYKHSSMAKSRKQERLVSNLSNEKFTKPFLKLTKSLCEKFDQEIKKNMHIENTIEAGMFQLLNQKTVFCKKTKKEMEQKQVQIQFENEKKEYEDDNQSPENENNEEPQEREQQADNQQQEEDHHIIGNKGQYFEDFIDNLQLN